MSAQDIPPDEELRLLRAARFRARVRAAVVVAVLALGGVGVWWLRQPKPEAPERALFQRLVPKWSIEKLNARDAEYRQRAMLEAAAPWPEVRARLETVATTYDTGGDAFTGAVAELNQASKAAGLAYWVDAPFHAGKQWVLTYDVLARSTWTAGARSVEVLRVRRLDRVNLEMAFLGHAGGDSPVVLVDRVEPELLDLIGRAYATGDRLGEVEEAARGAWRTVMQQLAGAEALAEAARLLEERQQAAERLNAGARGGLRFEMPERLVYGDEFLETLEPYADMGRPGGPVIVSTHLRELWSADRKLRSGPPREALEQVLERIVRDTEAHEARHAFEPIPEDAPVPPRVLDFVGDDDVPFARSAARELAAYMGQLHATEHPCAVLAMLAFRAGGDRLRSTPHHYASRILLQAVSAQPDEPLTRARLAGEITELCRAPAEQLRAKVAAAHEAVFMEPFVPASSGAPAPELNAGK